MNSIEIIKALSQVTQEAANPAGIPLDFDANTGRDRDLYARATLEDIFPESRSIGDPNATQHAAIGTWTVDIFMKDKNTGDAPLINSAKVFESKLSFACIKITPSGTRIFIDHAPARTLPKTDGYVRMQIQASFRATGTALLNPEIEIEIL
jgi:hypothetical protein